MLNVKFIVPFAGALSLLAGAALAQGAAVQSQGNPMPADRAQAMPAGSAHAAMSESDMMAMNKCKAMTHDAMMKDASCMAMMKAHPDMATADGGKKSTDQPAKPHDMMSGKKGS